MTRTMNRTMTRNGMLLLTAGLAAVFLTGIDPEAAVEGKLGPAEALAVIGRPATPGSVAGVARRTTRRTIRRGAYVAALPRSCVRATMYGYAVYQCGGAYYQASGGGYVVVTFD